MTATPTPMPLDAASVLATGELRYSSVWEDHLLLEQGLLPHEGDDLLAITSAGDNVLNLLLREPRRIIAIDVNPAQSALLELKVAAITTLEHVDFARLLGLATCAPETRVDLYERARTLLGTASRSWWDAHVATIESGIAASGRLERYIAGFREVHLSGTRDIVDRLMTAQSQSEQRACSVQLFTPEFTDAFARYFSAENLGARGRDPSQMQYVGGDFDVSAHLLARLRWVCTELPVAGNYYLERFFRGEVRDIESPPYLRADNYGRLRTLAPRVAIVTAEIGEFLEASAPRSLSHAALSDIFEYMPEDATQNVVDRLTRAIRVGGRIAYWNLFVQRAGSPKCPRLGWLESLSRKLWAHDRSWFYRAFRLEEVVA